MINITWSKDAFTESTILFQKLFIYWRKYFTEFAIAMDCTSPESNYTQWHTAQQPAHHHSAHTRSNSKGLLSARNLISAWPSGVWAGGIGKPVMFRVELEHSIQFQQTCSSQSELEWTDPCNQNRIFLKGIWKNRVFRSVTRQIVNRNLKNFKLVKLRSQVIKSIH